MNTKERDAKLNIAAAYGKIAEGDYADILNDTDPDTALISELSGVLYVTNKMLKGSTDKNMHYFIWLWVRAWAETCCDAAIFDAFCEYLLDESYYKLADEWREYFTKKREEEEVSND